MTAASDRFVRQAALVPQERLVDLDVTVVGVGAIGRQLSLQLAALGVRKLRLVDFDCVEATNITTQGYLREDIGRAKVAATASAVWQIEPKTEIQLVEDRYRPQLPLGEVLFCCVDSIEARSVIWKSAGRRVSFWCDGRMLGEVMRILSVADGQHSDRYAATLFERTEAITGTCTSRGVIYTASIAAGLMTHQLARWLRRLPIDGDLSLNLLASELAVN